MISNQTSFSKNSKFEQGESEKNLFASDILGSVRLNTILDSHPLVFQQINSEGVADTQNSKRAQNAIQRTNFIQRSNTQNMQNRPPKPARVVVSGKGTKVIRPKQASAGFRDFIKGAKLQHHAGMSGDFELSDSDDEILKGDTPPHLRAADLLVKQGGYVLADAEKYSVATQGLGPCMGIVVTLCKKSTGRKQVFLAHLDGEDADWQIRRMTSPPGERPSPPQLLSRVSNSRLSNYSGGKITSSGRKQINSRMTNSSGRGGKIVGRNKIDSRLTDSSGRKSGRKREYNIQNSGGKDANRSNRNFVGHWDMPVLQLSEKESLKLGIKTPDKTPPSRTPDSTPKKNPDNQHYFPVTSLEQRFHQFVLNEEMREKRNEIAGQNEANTTITSVSDANTTKENGAITSDGREMGNTTERNSVIASRTSRKKGTSKGKMQKGGGRPSMFAGIKQAVANEKKNEKRNNANGKPAYSKYAANHLQDNSEDPEEQPMSNVHATLKVKVGNETVMMHLHGGMAGCGFIGEGLVGRQELGFRNNNGNISGIGGGNNSEERDQYGDEQDQYFNVNQFLNVDVDEDVDFVQRNDGNKHQFDRQFETPPTNQHRMIEQYLNCVQRAHGASGGGKSGSGKSSSGKLLGRKLEFIDPKIEIQQKTSTEIQQKDNADKTDVTTTDKQVQQLPMKVIHTKIVPKPELTPDEKVDLKRALLGIFALAYSDGADGFIRDAVSVRVRLPQEKADRSMRYIANVLLEQMFGKERYEKVVGMGGDEAGDSVWYHPAKSGSLEDPLELKHWRNRKFQPRIRPSMKEQKNIKEDSGEKKLGRQLLIAGPVENENFLENNEGENFHGQLEDNRYIPCPPFLAKASTGITDKDQDVNQGAVTAAQNQGVAPVAQKAPQNNSTRQSPHVTPEGMQGRRMQIATQDLQMQSHPELTDPLHRAFENAQHLNEPFEFDIVMQSPPENTECQDPSEQKISMGETFPESFPDLKIVRMKSVGTSATRKQLAQQLGQQIGALERRGTTVEKRGRAHTFEEPCFVLKYKASDSSCTIKAPESTPELKARAANIVRAVTSYMHEMEMEKSHDGVHSKTNSVNESNSKPNQRSDSSNFRNVSPNNFAMHEQLQRLARWAKEVLGKDVYNWIRLYEQIRERMKHRQIAEKYRLIEEEEEEKMKRSRTALVDGLAMVAQIRRVQRELEREREEEEGMKLVQRSLEREREEEEGMKLE